MKQLALPFCLALSLLAVTAPERAIAQTDAPREQANPTLPKIELQAGIHLIKAEVASDFGTRARGLMYRDSLGTNQGMVFVFEEPSKQCFWMRNTPTALTIAFVADDGAIVNLADMKPFDESSHCSTQPVRYVLEMNLGWFARRGIKPGFKLTGAPLKP